MSPAQPKQLPPTTQAVRPVPPSCRAKALGEGGSHGEGGRTPLTRTLLSAATRERPHPSPSPGITSNFQHFGCFFSELADDADGDFLALLHQKGMALVTVNAAEGLVVDFHFQGLFGLLFRGGFGEVAQAAFPFIELVFVAAAKENLAYRRSLNRRNRRPPSSRRCRGRRGF